ncbi:MAG: acetyl-CoA acetyltransferase [Gammaproteobacteria bacterium]|nr:MAG: acetyl-CoA acetyltransferase [Gammaproteobacteria bacterium]
MHRLNATTPVIVGAGQLTQREGDPQQALAPMALAAEAARLALADSGAGTALTAQLDSLVVTRLFSDSTPRRAHGHGRADNPPGAVAAQLGATPRSRLYAEIGGNTPQKYLHLMAERIRRGEAAAVLLTGAECMATARAAVRAGLTLDWQRHDAGEFEDRGFGERLVTPHELAHGLGIPINTYPLFEQALRAARGLSVQDHLVRMGRLLASLNAVARHNPHAAWPSRLAADALVTPSAQNPWLGFPYTRLVNARDNVDQAAALVLTSAGLARELGIAAERQVFLHGACDLNDRMLMLDRVDYARSPAMARTGQAALAMAGLGLDDITWFDLYSCFASAVEIACESLGLAEDDPRGLTLTGGLPFFGGPGNNYSMHALVEAVTRLREAPETYALVTGNGGVLSKHTASVLSARPPHRPWQPPDSRRLQSEIDAEAAPPVTETPEGEARIETCTVMHGREGPQLGIVIARLLDSGARFVANTPAGDPAACQALMTDDAIGSRGRVSPQDGRNTFIPH